MAGGGGQTTSSNAPPQYVQDAHQQNLTLGNVIADRPYQTYGGPRIADWTPDQQRAFDMARGSVGAWQPFVGQAGQVFSDIASGGRGAGYDGVPIAGPAQPTKAGTAPVSSSPRIVGNGPTTVQVPTRAAPTRQEFDATAYLAANPDVADWAHQAAAATGQSLTDLASQHWNQYGQGEGRAGAMRTVETAYIPQMQASQIGSTAMMDAAKMNRGDIRDVTAGRFTDANLSAYLNPFTQSVIDTTMGDLSRQNDQLNNATRARLAAAGAFGGSRSAIAETENNRNYLDTVARTSAGLNSQNFTQAQQAIGSDQNRALQAAGMNQGMDWNVTQGNASFQQQAAAANQAAENARLARNAELAQQAAAANQGANITLSQFDASQAMQAALANQNATLQGNNQRLQAAQMLAGLGGQTQSLAGNDVSALLGIGSQQQGFNQANLDLAYQDFMRQLGYPQQQLQYRQGLLSGPIGSTTTQNTETDNTGQLVGTGISAAATVAAAFM